MDWCCSNCVVGAGLILVLIEVASGINESFVPLYAALDLLEVQVERVARVSWQSDHHFVKLGEIRVVLGLNHLVSIAVDIGTSKNIHLLMDGSVLVPVQVELVVVEDGPAVLVVVV